eukprot:5374304-Pleurochrysis_carterae.AAC.1
MGWVHGCRGRGEAFSDNWQRPCTPPAHRKSDRVVPTDKQDGFPQLIPLGEVSRGCSVYLASKVWVATAKPAHSCNGSHARCECGEG